MKKHLLLLALFSAFCFNGYAAIQIVNVQNNTFSPASFNIMLGDSVKWIWVNGTHTTSSTTIPAGATTWNQNINAASTTFLYVPNKVGTYNYQCNFHFSFGMIASFTVGCPTPVVSITNPIPIVVCAGTTVLLNSSASGGAPFTYQWQLSTNGGANWSNAGGATNSNYAVVATTSSLFYRVVVTNSCQNTGASQALSISVQTIAIGVTPFQSTVCIGSCTNLVAASTNGGTIAGTYFWSPATSLSSSTGATVVACPTASTTYTVTFVSAIGCSGTANAFVGVNPLPIVVGIANDYSVCAGTSVQLNATSSGGVTYTWSPTGGLSNPNISNPIAILTGSTTYTVTTASSNGCFSSDTVAIHVGASFQLTQTHVNTTCGSANGSIDLTLVGGAGGIFTYQWSNGATTQDLINIAAGNYAVTVSSNTGCSNVLTVAVNNTGGPVLSITHVDASCGSANGSINLSVSGGSAPYTYIWNNGVNTQDLTGLSAGTYIVTVTDANGCTSAIYAIIANTGNISLSETHTNASCGNATGGINLTVTNGIAPFIYLWSNNATSEDLTGLSAGTYIVTVTSASGCSGTLSVTITNSVPPTLTQTHTNASCGNANGSINLTASPAGNYFYFWSNGASTEDITGLLAGTYTVTVYSTGVGCVSTLTVTLLNANSGTLTQTHLNASCGNANGSINLSVSPNGVYNYLWSNGATTQDINNLLAGTYTVTVSNSTGCSNSLAVVVTGTNAPVIIATAANASCGLSNGYVVTTVSGGVSPYSYIWNTGATTSILQSVAAGVYSVTVYDQNQCSGTFTITVGSSTITLQVSIQSGTATFCAGGNAVLVVAPLGASYQWTKNNVNINGATNSTYTATVSGTFRCVVTYSGCGTITSNGVVISKLATPTATITANGPTTFCAGQSVMLNVNAQAGVTYQWRKNNATISGATNTSYSATVAGNYRCLVTNISTGCNKLSNIITVTVNCKLEELTIENTFKFFPNPFNSTLTIQLNTVSTIAVYNVLGQKLIEVKDVTGEINIGEELKAGMYFLELRVNNEVISSQRIVKVE